MRIDTFEIRKLPLMAQFSSFRDFIVRNFNNDGFADLILEVNDFCNLTHVVYSFRKNQFTTSGGNLWGVPLLLIF